MSIELGLDCIREYGRAVPGDRQTYSNGEILVILWNAVHELAEENAKLVREIQALKDSV